MSDLYPSFDMPDIVGATENTVVAFPKSWLWDWDICDFVQTGSGDVVEVDGLTAWAQWCVKAILTQRLAFVVYDWNYGADIESCLKQPTRAITEAELEREITEALLTDPRTAEVKNFRFEWSGDELTVWFTVVNALGQPAEIQVGVGYREVQRQFSLSRVEQYVSDWMSGTLVGVEVNDRGRLTLIRPPTPTFARNSVAYKMDGSQVAANQPRFDVIDGVMGLMVEEGTTNIFPHSKSFEECSGTHIGDGDPSNSNGVATYVGGGWRLATQYNSATIKISEDGGLFGSKRLSFIHDGSSGWKAAISSDWSIVAGRTYTVTVWARANQASTKSFSTGYAFYKEGGQQYLFNWPDGYPTDAKNAGKWVRGIRTFTAAANESGRVYLYGLTDGEAGLIIDYDGLQVEEKPYATSFIDGTRSPEILTIPTAGVLNPQEGTVECWVYVNDVVRRNITNNWSTVVLIRKGSYVANWIWIEHSFGGVWALQIRKEDGTITGQGDFSDSLTPDGWHYFAVRWNAQAGTADLFHNGVKRVSLIGVAFPAEYDRIEVGHRSGGSGDWLNSLIDDLRISNRARTDAEILSAYQSNQPLPIDENTTYALRFDNSLKVGRGGYRLSKPVYLKSLGTCNGSNISWEANIPAGCDVKVYASVDGSTFQECENNAPIPSLSEGVSLVDKVLVIKEVLLTEDGVNRPELMVVRYNVDGTVTLRG